MSNISKFGLREWLVPPVLLPIFFALVIAGAVLIQWLLLACAGPRRQRQKSLHDGTFQQHEGYPSEAAIGGRDT